MTLRSNSQVNLMSTRVSWGEARWGEVNWTVNFDVNWFELMSPDVKVNGVRWGELNLMSTLSQKRGADPYWDEMKWTWHHLWCELRWAEGVPQLYSSWCRAQLMSLNLTWKKSWSLWSSEVNWGQFMFLQVNWGEVMSIEINGEQYNSLQVISCQFRSTSGHLK